MKIIDTEKLTLFHQELTKIASNNEEGWYLLKRMMSEMESDDLFYNPMVMQELYEAQLILERMMDVLGSFTKISSSLCEDYETIALNHTSIIHQMAQYAQGLKAIGHSLCQETQAQRADMPYNYTAPIKQSVQMQLGEIEVDYES